MLKINEIFYSLQGEGADVGLPTIFIRLTGCNLRCKYCFARGGEDNIYLNPLIAKKGLDELIKKDTKYLNNIKIFDQ